MENEICIKYFKPMNWKQDETNPNIFRGPTIEIEVE